MALQMHAVIRLWCLYVLVNSMNRKRTYISSSFHFYVLLSLFSPRYLDMSPLQVHCNLVGSTNWFDFSLSYSPPFLPSILCLVVLLWENMVWLIMTSYLHRHLSHLSMLHNMIKNSSSQGRIELLGCLDQYYICCFFFLLFFSTSLGNRSCIRILQ